MYKLKEQFIGKAIMDKDGTHELKKDMSQKDLKKFYDKGHFNMIENVEDVKTDKEKINKKAIESNRKQ